MHQASSDSNARSVPRKILERVLSKELNPADHAILSFVFERTIVFNKQSERITAKIIVEGVPSAKGELLHQGLRISRKSAGDKLQQLCDRGYLVREACNKFATAFRYALNLQLIVERAKEWRMNYNPAKFLNDYREDFGHSGKKYPEHTEKSSVHNKRNKQPKNNNSKLRSKNAVKSGKLSASILSEEWHNLCKASWPDFTFVRLSPKERGCAKNLIKDLGKDTLPIIEWCIDNWHVVKRSKFPEARGVAFPEQPDFQFMYNFRKNFVEVYGEREFYSRLAHHTNAGLVVHLRKQGYSIDDAFDEAESRSKLQRREDAVVAREDRAKKTEEGLSHREKRVARREAQPIVTLTDEEKKARNSKFLDRVKNRGAKKEAAPLNRNIADDLTEWK